MIELGDIRTVEQVSARIQHCCCDGAGYIHLNVPVGHPLFGQAIACVCRRDASARAQAERLMRQSGITAEQRADFQFATFRPDLARALPGVSPDDNFNRMRSAMRYCEQYAAAPHGWLILAGPYGSGKTHLAFAIANACLARGVGVYAAPVARLMEMLRQGFQDSSYDEQMENIRRVPMLVLDDLGAERQSDWTTEVLVGVLEHRLEQHLPLVVTTNLNVMDNECPLPQRILSRLRTGVGVKGPNGFGRVLTIAAGDYRPGKTWRAA